LTLKHRTLNLAKIIRMQDILIIILLQSMIPLGNRSISWQTINMFHINFKKLLNIRMDKYSSKITKMKMSFSNNDFASFIWPF
jgi:hypothetical protein